MDIIIRIIIMILCVVCISYFCNLIHKFKHLKSENYSDKIIKYIWYAFYMLLIILPGYYFIECFKYIITYYK